MNKLPRTNVIEKQLAVVIEDNGHTMTPAQLDTVQGGIGFAPMYGAPRPPRPTVPADVWTRLKDLKKKFWKF